MKSDLTYKQDSKTEGACCEMNIHIDSRGTINIYNCTSEVTGASADCNQPSQHPPAAIRVCIPVSPKHKPKRNLQARLNPILKQNLIPSTLAAGAYHMIRRFVARETPGNSLEERVFSELDKLSTDLQDVLACSITKIDQLPPKISTKLFNQKIIRGISQPIAVDDLRDESINEILLRTAEAAYGDKACLDAEHPGLARPLIGLDSATWFTPCINSVNGFRTNTHKPALGLHDYRRDEFQQTCVYEYQSEEARQNCSVMTDNCPGNQVEGYCLRVPEVRPGENVILEGFNFFNINSMVRLTAKSPGTTHRSVSARVCGDTQTPLDEIINGQQITIADNRVHDILTFQVPKDLPPGIYGLIVEMPNNTGVSQDYGTFYSDGSQYIRVLDPTDVVYLISTEKLSVREETSPGWSGSDDLGLQILVPFQIANA